MYWHCEEKIDLHHSWDLTLFSRSHSAWYKYVPEPFNWSALKLWRAVVLHEVLSKKNVFCAWICFLFHEKWQNIARNIFFFSSSFEHTPNFVKDLYGRISRKIRQKVSLRLVLSHSRSVRAIYFYRFLASTTFVETEICTVYLIFLHFPQVTLSEVIVAEVIS